MRISDWSSDVCSSDLDARQKQQSSEEMRDCTVATPRKCWPEKRIAERKVFFGESPWVEITAKKHILKQAQAICWLVMWQSCYPIENLQQTHGSSWRLARFAAVVRPSRFLGLGDRRALHLHTAGDATGILDRQG